VSTLDHTLEPNASSVRRLEVITGTERRRRFSEDDKARIVEETLAPGAVVSDVARRHGLSPQQLFTWRQEARRGPVTPAPDVAPVFVPAVVHEASVGAGDKTNNKAARRRRGRQTNGIIEIEIDGVTVRVGGGADVKTVAAGSVRLRPPRDRPDGWATRPVDFRKGARGLGGLGASYSRKLVTAWEVEAAYRGAVRSSHFSTEGVIRRDRD
jgi:transposase